MQYCSTDYLIIFNILNSVLSQLENLYDVFIVNYVFSHSVCRLE